MLARLSVRPDGSVRNVAIIESSNPCVNEAAVQNVCRMRFSAQPGSSQGDVDRIIDQTVAFEFGDGAQEAADE